MKVFSQRLFQRPRVLIVGGGFAGLSAAKELKDAPVDITLIDRQNYHLFQPLLYQVATAVLSPADIASPIRHILKDQNNVEVVLDELVGVDFERKVIKTTWGETGYDYLVLAMGVTHSYFGHDEWSKFTPGLKTIDDALEIRRRILLAFEEAEREQDASSRQAKLTFVVVGGGPTGVEMAGALKEIAADSIPHDFRHIDTTTAQVILVEAADRLLSAMPVRLGQQAQRDLEKMGVQVRLGSPVTEVCADGVQIDGKLLPTENVIWAAGVKGASVMRELGVELDSQGRVPVAKDLSLPEHPEVFVVGDLAKVEDLCRGGMVPGVAPAATQMGGYVAGIIRGEITKNRSTDQRPDFKYFDKGTLATIGRFKAVAAFGKYTLRGSSAWLLWCFVHIFFLIGFRKRVFVMLSWIWNYVAFAKGARLITGFPRTRIKSPRGIIPYEKTDLTDRVTKNDKSSLN